MLCTNELCVHAHRSHQRLFPAMAQSESEPGSDRVQNAAGVALHIGYRKILNDALCLHPENKFALVFVFLLGQCKDCSLELSAQGHFVRAVPQ